MTTVTIFTAEEVAQILRCNRESVYRWVKAGRLKSCDRNGLVHRFTQEHIDEFLNGPKPEAAPKASKPSRSPRYSK